MSISTRTRASRYLLFLMTFLLLLASPSASSKSAAQKAPAKELLAIQRYIKQSWHTLTRSSAQLAKAAPDPKFSPMADGRWPVYVSRRENIKRIERNLRTQMPAEDFAKIVIRPLPDDVSGIREHGLLYLPYPYVVPGGR